MLGSSRGVASLGLARSSVPRAVPRPLRLLLLVELSSVVRLPGVLLRRSRVSVERTPLREEVELLVRVYRGIVSDPGPFDPVMVATFDRVVRDLEFALDLDRRLAPLVRDSLA